jgi:hypothetical protein
MIDNRRFLRGALARPGRVPPAVGGTDGVFGPGNQENPEPPVKEPPNRPKKPPVEEPGETPPEPPVPNDPPVEEPPPPRRKPPVEEPPPDPEREPTEPPVRTHGSGAETQ